MDFETLNLHIDYLGSSGIILSIEQKAVLQTSLTLLKFNEKLKHLHFWGKIRGLHGDYYIAKGFFTDCYTSTRFYYSKNCLNWGLLNPPDATLKGRFPHFRESFTGEPSHVFETKVIQSENDKIEDRPPISMKEEDRLACLLHVLEHDVHVAPRKALISTSGTLVKNKRFQGLNLSEASQLYNFMHVRRGLKDKRASVKRSDFDAAVDFGDTIEGDTPKRCWSLQFERGGRLVVLKSLLWIGYVFYHVLGTAEFGSLYFGTGQYNIDLPFML